MIKAIQQLLLSALFFINNYLIKQLWKLLKASKTKFMKSAENV